MSPTSSSAQVVPTVTTQTVKYLSNLTTTETLESVSVLLRGVEVDTVLLPPSDREIAAQEWEDLEYILASFGRTHQPVGCQSSKSYPGDPKGCNICAASYGDFSYGWKLMAKMDLAKEKNRKQFGTKSDFDPDVAINDAINKYDSQEDPMAQAHIGGWGL